MKMGDRVRRITGSWKEEGVGGYGKIILYKCKKMSRIRFLIYFSYLRSYKYILIIFTCPSSLPPPFPIPKFMPFFFLFVSFFNYESNL